MWRPSHLHHADAVRDARRSPDYCVAYCESWIPAAYSNMWRCRRRSPQEECQRQEQEAARLRREMELEQRERASRLQEDKGKKAQEDQVALACSAYNSRSPCTRGRGAGQKA